MNMGGPSTVSCTTRLSCVELGTRWGGNSEGGQGTEREDPPLATGVHGAYASPQTRWLELAGRDEEGGAL
jgi:hypothetical protein